MYNIAKRFAEVNLSEIPRQNLRKVEWLVDLSSQPRVEWAFVGRPSNSRGSVLLYHRQKLTLVACDTPASFSSSNISSGESWWIMVNHGESIPFRLRHGTNWRPIHRSVLLCWDVFATSAEVCIMDWLGMVCRVLWMHWRDVQYLCDRRLIYTIPYLSQIFSDNNRIQ